MNKQLIFIVVIISSTLQLCAQEWNTFQKIVAADRSPDDAFSSAVDVSNQFIVVGAIFDAQDASNENPVSQAGSAYIFERDAEGHWQQGSKLVAGNRSSQDHFGCAVAVADFSVIVGARRQGYDAEEENFVEQAGAAYIFERSVDGSWGKTQKLVASDRQMGDLFGYAVAIDGNYAVVSALFQDFDSAGADSLPYAGAAYVFERDTAGQWLEMQKLTASDRLGGARFGTSVAISGDYILIGAPNAHDGPPGAIEHINAGAAYFFKRQEDGHWIEQQKLIVSDIESRDFFGRSLAIEGRRAIIGAYNKESHVPFAIDGYGAAYVFEMEEDGFWEEQQKLMASDGSLGDLFGTQVDLSGDHLVVGASSDAEGYQGESPVGYAGSAYTFRRSPEGVWEEVNKLMASERNIDDYFGHDVAISGNTLVCGMTGEDEDINEGDYKNDAGAGVIFQLACAPETYSSISLTLTGCERIQYNGNWYTESQTVLDTLRNNFYQNCDTIRHTELIVHPSYSFTIDTSLIEGEQITVGAHTYDEAGTYIDTLNSVNGCDSIITTNINLLTSHRELRSVSKRVNVFPNPSKGTFNIELDKSQRLFSAEVFDQLGRRIYYQKTDPSIHTIELRDYLGGRYTLRLRTATTVFTVPITLIRS